MLVLEVFGYLKRRASNRTMRLANFVAMSKHHGTRKIDPRVALIIPTRDKFQLLFACVESIKNNTDYTNYEIIVVDNGSTDNSTLAYLRSLESQGHTVLHFPEPFNYSKICNIAAKKTSAEYLCFLNNDTEVLSPDWLAGLMDHAVQPSVGLVGCRLVYPDRKIQHIGVALGFTGLAGHPMAGVEVEDLMGFDTDECFEVSAVTFACVVTSNKQYKALNGLDPKFKVGLNDIDFAMRMRKSGRINVLCGKSCLIHHESKSRKSTSSISGGTRAAIEVIRFLKLHGKNARHDDFFKP